MLSEIMAAEIFSFGLESMIFDAKREFTSYNDVYTFFRQGFGKSLSEKLAANIWNDNQVKLKDGDRIMESPQEVYIRLVKPNSAAISYETPTHRKHIWGDSKLTKLIVRNENGRWKIFQEP